MESRSGDAPAPCVPWAESPVMSAAGRLAGLVPAGMVEGMPIMRGLLPAVECGVGEVREKIW